MPPLADITRRMESGVPVSTVSGEIDLSNVDSVEIQLLRDVPAVHSRHPPAAARLQRRADPDTERDVREATVSDLREAVGEVLRPDSLLRRSLAGLPDRAHERDERPGRLLHVREDRPGVGVPVPLRSPDPLELTGSSRDVLNREVALMRDALSREVFNRDVVEGPSFSAAKSFRSLISER